MAVSTDINLPKTHASRFPDRCVICHLTSPNSQTRVITGTVGWWTWIFWWFGKPFVVKVPTCRGCGWWLYARSVLGTLAILAITAATYYWIWPHFKDFVPDFMRRWAMLGVVVLCLIPLFVLEYFFAKPFQMTAYDDNVEYEFANRDYAIEFACLNHEAAWVKLNGVFMAFRDDE